MLSGAVIILILLGYCWFCTTLNGVRVAVHCYHNAGALHLGWLAGYVAAIMPVLCTFKYIGVLHRDGSFAPSL